MNDDQHSCRRTRPQKDEAILPFGMLRIKEEASTEILEDAPSFFKNSMLRSIGSIFLFVPIEPQHI